MRFFEKKRSKKRLVIWPVALKTPRRRLQKFLLLFFKKEALACLQ
jgi:hypothetical protein